MPNTLDFIIGGMPRGGTTAVGNLFNVHPDSYCYAAETHWLPLLMEFAEYGPVPDVAWKLVERIALAQNRQVLYEMARYSVTRGAHKRILIFEEADLQPLTSAMMELIRKGLWGQGLAEAALPILRRHFVERTGKAVVGEKTPNNLFAFDAYGALGTKAAFMVLREPFAVVRSMQNRGKDATDVYASPFRSELAGLIGIWLSYVEAINRARRHAEAHLLTYEEMMQNPLDRILQVYDLVGLDTHETKLVAASKHFIEVTKGAPWDKLTPAERTFIWCLTEATRKKVGYDDAFYDMIGLAPQRETDTIDLSEELYMPLHGVNDQAEGEGGRWLMRSGLIGLQSAAGRSKATFKLWGNFPAELAKPGENVTLTLRAGGPDGAVLGSAAVKAGTAEMVEITVDLTGFPPAMQSSKGEIRLVAFEASKAYRSYLVPVATTKTVLKLFNRVRRRAMGTDRREMSFALLDISYH